jgi:hypothetical protein
MAPKLSPWAARAKKAITHLAKPRKFPIDKSAKLIDYLASTNAVPRHQLLTRAVQIIGADAKNFVNTTLGNVTTAVHGGKKVPDSGGWYSHDKATDVYAMDQGFSVAWKSARSLAS